MGLQTYEGIAVVENQGRGMRIETYQSQVALVMSLMNHGGFGGGCGYGCAEHVHALDEIGKHLAVVRKSIQEQNKEDVRNDRRIRNRRRSRRSDGE